jgi:hypothetical protein
MNIKPGQYNRVGEKPIMKVGGIGNPNEPITLPK